MPVTYQGLPVKLGRRILYTVRYSDMLLIQLLRRFRPQLYRVHTVAKCADSDEIAKRLMAARQRMREAQEKAAAAAG
jgi:hypothetical protein